MRRAGWLILTLAALVLLIQVVTPTPDVRLVLGAIIVGLIGGVIVADHPPYPELEPRRGGYVHPPSSSSSHYPDSPTKGPQA